MAKRKKNSGTAVLMGAVIVLFLILVASLMLLFMMPEFSLSTDRVTLEVGDSFSPLNYIAELKNASTADIAIVGSVNTQVPGTYKLTYSLGKESYQLNVTVQDTTAPVIELLYPEIAIKEGEKLNVQELARFTDLTQATLELDVRGQDLSVPGVYTVLIVCTDTSGNRSQKELTVTVESVDVTPPVITVGEDATIMVGDYIDLLEGFSVTDDVDAEPAFSVDNGGFDASVPGSYTITFTAVDAHGNETSAQRTIVVTKDYIPILYSPEGGTHQWDARGIANQPYLVCVNRAMCTITVYGKDERGNYTVPEKAFVCSVGKPGNETPLGRFNTALPETNTATGEVNRNRYTWCRMVDDSYGRYAIRIYRGYMFHSVCYVGTNVDQLEYWEYNKLGGPASLGCVRLCLADEKWLYDNCPIGFPVEIYDDTAVCGPLGKPEPIRIDENNITLRGWDPTDWDPKSPWNR